MADKSFADYVKDLMGVLPTVNGNPMLSVTSMTDENARYREDPFYKSRDAQERKRLAEEEAKKAAQSGSGLFGSMPEGGGDGVQGRNYYQDIEDRFYQENLTRGLTPETAKTLAEQQAFEIQSANNARINSALTLFGNAVMPGAAALGLSKYGPEGYMDYLQGNLRTMIGDSGGYQSLFTPKAAGIAAPVVSGQSNYNTISASQQIANDILAREAENRAMSEISRNYGGFRDNGTYVTSYGPVVSTSGMSPETRAGVEAAQASFGYGTDADYYGD